MLLEVGFLALGFDVGSFEVFLGRFGGGDGGRGVWFGFGYLAGH